MDTPQVPEKITFEKKPEVKKDEGVSHELAYLDAQGGRPLGFAGARADRNARLYVP